MRMFSKALIVFWATILLVSSTCFGADIHYCKGEAQTFGIFETAKPCKMHKKKAEKKMHKCCMAKKKAAIPVKEGTPVMKNGKCCYNEQVSFKTDVEQNANGALLHLKTDVQDTPFWETRVSINWITDRNNVNTFRGPPDPHLVTNYQVFFQVFRI